LSLKRALSQRRQIMKPSKIKPSLILFLCFFILLSLKISSATQFKAKDNIFIPEFRVIPDDLFVGGNNIKVDGTIEGDLFTGSRYLVHAGKVRGSLFSAGQNLDILGEVEGSATAMSQNTSVSGMIKRNLINIGSSLNIRHTGKIEGDVIACGNELTVEGEIGKRLKAKVASVVISGTVNGNVDVETKNITLMPTAKIKGNFKYKSEKKAKIESGAEITGKTEWVKIKAKEKKKKGFFTTSNVLIRSLLLVASIITGLFLILISKRYVQSAEKNVFDSFLKSLGLGFILMICIPIAIVILLITLIGIPIAIICLFAYLVLFYISKIFVGIAVGKKVLTGFAKDKEAPMGWALILGLILLTILTNIPYIGWVVYVVVVLTGFGAAILARKVLVS
jgi:cytoskeletal protein CcmA (bactofilin family)